jgi:hypothetical protein
MKVAWHEVPGKSADTRRPVGNGMIRFVGDNSFVKAGSSTFESQVHLQPWVQNLSYRSLRDGAQCRQFPGTACQDFGKLSRALPSQSPSGTNTQNFEPRTY